MKPTIATESPLAPDGLALIEGSEAAPRDVCTKDECFTFSPAELAHPGIAFFVARQNGAPVGCVALCNCGDYAEIKRLFVTPAARAGGHTVIRLETGPRLAAAVALYRTLDYNQRGPFGTYAEHPASLFMENCL